MSNKKEVYQPNEALPESQENHKELIDRTRSALAEFDDISKLPEKTKKDVVQLKKRIQILAIVLSPDGKLVQNPNAEDKNTISIDDLNLDATQAKEYDQLIKKDKPEVAKELKQILDSLDQGEERIQKEAERVRHVYESNKASWWEWLKHKTKNFGKKTVSLAKSALNTMYKAGKAVLNFAREHPVLTTVIVVGIAVGIYAFLNWGAVEKIATDTIGKIIGDEGAKNIGKTIGQKLPTGGGLGNTLPGLGSTSTPVDKIFKEGIKEGSKLFGTPGA